MLRTSWPRPGRARLSSVQGLLALMSVSARVVSRRAPGKQAGREGRTLVISEMTVFLVNYIVHTVYRPLLWIEGRCGLRSVTENLRDSLCSKSVPVSVVRYSRPANIHAGYCSRLSHVRTIVPSHALDGVTLDRRLRCTRTHAHAVCKCSCVEVVAPGAWATLQAR